MLEHEVHFLGRYLLGRDDEVALILAVFVINPNDKLSVLKVADCFFDTAQFEISHIYKYV